MILLTYLVFIFSIFISFYIPGYLLLLVFTFKLSPLEREILSFIIGTVLFIGISYIAAFIAIPQAILFVLEILFLLFLFRKQLILVKQKQHTKQPNFLTVILRDTKQWIKSRKIKKQHFLHIDYWMLILFSVGAIGFTSQTFFFGLPTTTGMHFVGEGLAHLAFIKSQALHFPLIQPDVAYIPIQHYHFFYDFLASRFYMLFGFAAEDLHFRLFPFYLSLLYGGSILLLGGSITTRPWILRICLFGAFLSIIITTPEPSQLLGIICIITALSLLRKIKQSKNYLILFTLLILVIVHGRLDKGIKSQAPTITVTQYDQKLYNYFAQQIGSDEVIVYVPQNTWPDQPLIAAMTGRSVYVETKEESPISNERRHTIEQLKKALSRCHENEIRGILKEIGAKHILTEKNDTCLASSNIRGTKIASKTLQLYILEDR